MLSKFEQVLTSLKQFELVSTVWESLNKFKPILTSLDKQLLQKNLILWNFTTFQWFPWNPSHFTLGNKTSHLIICDWLNQPVGACYYHRNTSCIPGALEDCAWYRVKQWWEAIFLNPWCSLLLTPYYSGKKFTFTPHSVKILWKFTLILICLEPSPGPILYSQALNKIEHFFLDFAIFLNFWIFEFFRWSF